MFNSVKEKVNYLKLRFSTIITFYLKVCIHHPKIQAQQNPSIQWNNKSSVLI